MLFFGQFCFGQTKNISIPTYKSGDTSFWYKWQKEKFAKIGLVDLITLKDGMHFRLSTETQAVEIWTADFRTFYGTFANYTTTYDPDKYERKKPKPEKFYSNKTELDTATSRRVYYIFMSLSIFSIPTQDSIPGWYSGNDGIEYLIEFSTPAEYSFKGYWTPSAYKDKIKEAALIDSLTNQLETTLQMQQSFSTFIDSLPFGSYNAGGISIVTTLKANKRRKHK